MSRRADGLAVVGNLFYSIAKFAWDAEPFATASPMEALQLMFIMSFIIVATKEGKPRNIHQIAQALNVPDNTMRRRLKKLQNTGRIKMEKHNYVIADWDYFDRFATMHRIETWYRMTREAAKQLHEIRRLAKLTLPPAGGKVGR